MAKQINIFTLEDEKNMYPPDFEPMTRFRYFMYYNDIPLWASRIVKKDDNSLIAELYDFINPESYKIIINILLNSYINLNEIEVCQTGPIGDVMARILLVDTKITIIEKPETFDGIDYTFTIKIEFKKGI